MRKYILSATIFFLAAVSLSSCLGEADPIVYYEDAAITSFKLGTLNRYIHTKAKDGTDSVYKETLNCAGYTFYIDQSRSVVWNPDSLPNDVDASAVICTIGVSNQVTVALKSETRDSLKNYSERDSIDFRNPREFVVYNSTGSGYRKYMVHVNVHKENGDSCVWTKVGSAGSIANLADMKALNLGNKIFLFGTEGESTKVFSTTLDDGRNWTELSTLAADASKSALIKGGKFYCLADGQLLSSADAANWQPVGSASLRQLVAASSMRLYAIDNDGKLLSSADNGLTWEEELTDADASFFPTEAISYACHPLRTDATAEKIVLIGNRSAADYPDDKYAMVWTKIDEGQAGSRSHVWNFVEQDSRYKNCAPRAENWQIVNYDGMIKAACGNGLGQNNVAALRNIYNSADDGLTWIKDTTAMIIPQEIPVGVKSFAMVADKKNSLWIICSGSGQVWKARINRLVWKKEKDWFEE